MSPLPPRSEAAGARAAVLAVCCVVALALPLAAAPVTFRTTDFAPAADSVFSIDGKAQLAVYRAFRKAYPDIIPEGNPLGLRFEGAAGEAPLLMSIAGGTAPDVLHVNGRQSGSYIERGFLLPLDEFVNQELTAAEARSRGVFDDRVMYLDELRQRVRPQVWDAVCRVGADGRKHVYYLPFHYMVRVLAYNKALFQEAGLDPENGYPKTWDDLLRTARTLHRPDQDAYGMLVDTAGGASWIALPFFLSMGSQIVVQDPKTRLWRAAFNDQGSIAAADFYLQLVAGPWRDPRTGETRYGAGRTRDAWHLWDRGRVGMVLLYANDVLINLDSHLSGLDVGEVGIVPVPASPNGTSITELHMRGLGICAATKDPVKVRAAWTFIRFVGSPAAEREIVRTYVENGYGSFINPEKLKEFGYDEHLESVPKQWAETLAYSLENCAPEPYGKNCQVYILRASKPLEAALDEDLPHNPDRDRRLARLQELYDQAVADVNEKMLGRVPDDVMRTRRRVAAAVILSMVTAFAVLFVYIWRLFSPPGQQGPGGQRGRRRFLPAYLLLAPAIATILIFHYFPLLRGAVMAFQDYNVMGGSAWVGLDNFAMVLFDGVFWLSLLRTAEYVVWSLALVFVPPILLAIVLSEIPLGKMVLRVVYYLPAIVSGLVVMLMWKMFLDPSPSGMFNQVLSVIGIGPQRWLQDRSLAMVSIILPLAWAGIGPGSLIYLAALKTVPEDLYEAAAMDGAGFFRRVWHVTFPTMRPLILIQLIFVLIGSFQSADNVLVMTGGGPDNATNVLGLEIFYNAYVYLRFGTAIAIAWLLGFLLVGLTMLQMRRISRMGFTAAGEN